MDGAGLVVLHCLVCMDMDIHMHYAVSLMCLVYLV
jgi:hypothetical protein